MESNTTGSNSFLWTDVDWNALRALRERFLQFDSHDASTNPDRPDYWRSVSELAGYDFTFAERIGWKWDTVLAELATRGWTPPAGTLLDWGCGTGVAARRVVATWPEAVRELHFSDRSGAARDFATAKARTAFPNLPIRSTDTETAADLLVISHVLNELSHEALEQLLALIEKATAVIWVEPGTAAVSRKLIAMRERLLKLGRFRVIAPCTHAQACGMLTAGNERHWCHHFAKIPGYVHTDAGWARFSKTLEIDLGSLPFSFLVLDSRPALASTEPENARIIGRPRNYKGFAKVLSCQSDGVRELVIQRRDAPALFKEMKKDPGSLYRWQRDGDKIRDGERLF